MSAITGIFYRDGRTVNLELFKKMNNTLSHRGPDGYSAWNGGLVAFGHQMLWTTPESLHEKLPFHDEKAGLVITTDARIDNRNELSEELDIENKENISDSYFILKSYERWGEKCPEHLLGDFAFAIWDENDEKLFCARDHMGVKPFYYYLNDDIFVFATEIKALLTIPEVNYDLNELKIAYYLMYENIEKESTFYEDIYRLYGACSLKIDSKLFEIKKYWKLDPEFKVEMDNDKEYMMKFREIFTEAVNCRLRSAFPIGFELSGGLDSSSVVCIAKEILKKDNYFKDINTYSFSFKDIPEVDEGFYIKEVIDSGGIHHSFVKGDNVSPMEEIGSIISRLEQPPFNPYFPIITKLFKKMQEDNIRVDITGIGGDGTISHGVYSMKDLASTFQFKKLRDELNCYSNLSNQSFIRLLINQIIFPFFPTKIQNLLSYITKQNEKFILNKEFAKRYGGKRRLNNLCTHHGEISTKTARKYHYSEIDYVPMQIHLEDIDKLASASHIEPRHPYFDKRLIEFCYGVPNEMKFRFGWGRFLHRISLENILPPNIQWRYSKTNFAPLLERNLLLFEKDILEQILEDENMIIKDYIDMEIMKNNYREYISEKHPRASDVRDLWLMMSLYFYLLQNK